MFDNKISIEFISKSENEAFARVAISAFIAQIDPLVDEITDVKTAVSEAVTNSIIHGYEGKEDGIIRIDAELYNNIVTISVLDKGKGIKDIKKAMQPLYTSRPDLERSGMGFTVMQSFMDDVKVESEEGNFTKVIIKKKFTSIN
ncbi:anti-sigma F factor [Clostridium sp. BJN0001]|uniref:anti-sigma F factor n=1 Tax=Clostridium sp. BJN0001 TaxID=2930219 RepID=UPI001FD1050F|nr:anti-sigma F factor [Clostridium sp. BJN0001]